jgi:hypothetical protein
LRVILGGFAVTIASTKRGKFVRASAVGRRLRAIVARFKRPAALQGMSRAEFEQTARDLDLSHPQLYGLLTGRVVSTGLVEERLNKLDAFPERITTRPAPEPEHLATGAQACLPIGPSCC